MWIKPSQADVQVQVNAFRMRKMFRQNSPAPAATVFVFNVWFCSTASSFEAQLYALHPSQTQGRLEMGGLSNGEIANDWAPQVLERKSRRCWNPKGPNISIS